MRCSALVRTTRILLALLVLLLGGWAVTTTLPLVASPPPPPVTLSWAFDAEDACGYAVWTQRQASGFAKAPVR